VTRKQSDQTRVRRGSDRRYRRGAGFKTCARCFTVHTFFFFSSFALTAFLTPLPQWHHDDDHDDLHCKQRNNQTNNDLILKVSSKRK
jgi:hypothetical protein